MDPSSTPSPPAPLINRAIAVRKLKNRTKQYAAIKKETKREAKRLKIYKKSLSQQ